MEKKKIVISSIIVSILLLGVIASTYAYFQAVISNGSSTPTSVKANTISGLTFNAGKNIIHEATQTNMASGASDLSDTTEATVTLKSRNDASDNYNYKTCVNITENTFVHSAVSDTETSYGRTKNLFDIYKVGSYNNGGTYLANNNDGTLSVSSDNSYDFGSYTQNKLSDFCPECEIGKTYTLSLKTTTTNTSFILMPLDPKRNTWIFGRSRTLTQSDLDSQFYFYVDDINNVYTYYDIQIEEGTTATPYDQYGYITSPELVLTITKNGTTVLTQDIASTSGEICVPTTSGGSTLTHNISASANATTTDTWKATITFKNLSTNQNINTNKTFNANFVFTKV